MKFNELTDMFDINAKNEGPRRIPANISPSTPGWFSFWKNILSTFATIMAIVISSNTLASHLLKIGMVRCVFNVSYVGAYLHTQYC